MSADEQRRKFIKTGILGSALVTTPFVLSSFFSQEQKLTTVKSSDIDPVKDNLEKVRNFDTTFSEDVFLVKEDLGVFQTTYQRLQRVQSLIGYANFNLVGFDEVLNLARNYPVVGSFTDRELAFIEKIFFFEAEKYGFYGKKVITDLTSTINKKETIKISGSGHYLFKGEPQKVFKQLQNDIGPDLILTSGVRSVVKQLNLFLAKLDKSNRNISKASRSLAPPGHSYHGIGDFDVGKRGLGHYNFTAEFARTNEYKMLTRLKYIDIRYREDNQLGVRYEPWHIKVV